MLRKSNIKLKNILIFTKFVPHLSAFMYILYTLLQFADIDPIFIGYLFSYSLLSWLVIFLMSILLKYCYVHRLPLYYILANEFLTITDHYIGIPISEFNLLLVHLLIIGFLIFGYTYYYLKFCKK